MHGPDKIEHLRMRVETLYQRSLTGCCLHVVTDDLNVDDDDVAFCIKWARGKACWECYGIGRDLANLTVRERQRVTDPHGEYFNEDGSEIDPA